MTRPSCWCVPRLSASLLPCLLLAAAAAAADPLRDADAYRQAGDARAAMLVLKDYLGRAGADQRARTQLALLYLDLAQGAAAEQELQRAITEGALDPADAAVDLAEARLLQGKFAEIIQDPATESAPEPARQAQLHAIRGEAYLGLGKPESAGLEFGKALGLLPDQARAVLGQAKLAVARGDHTGAREAADQAVRIHPDDARVWQFLGELEFSEGRFAQADAAFTRAIAQGYSDWMPLYERALVRVESGQLDPAAADLEAAAKLVPAFPGLSYARGLLALKRTQPEQAFAELSLYLKYRPQDPQAAYLAGVALAQLDRRQEAEEYLERAQKATPGAVPVALALAKLRLTRGDLKGAETLLRPFADQKDPNPEVLTLLGRAMQGQGRADEAKALAAQVAVAQPEDAGARLRLVESQLAAGDRAGAERELRALLQADPKNELAQQRLLLVALEKKDAKAALAEAQALVALTPNSARAYNGLAAARQLGGDEAGARRDLQRALELEPGFADAAFNLAAIEIKSRNPGAARKLYEEVLAATPEETTALLLLTQLDVAEGQRGAAFERLSAALARSPANLDVRLNLARGYLTAGQVPEAQRTLQAVPPAQATDPRLLLLSAQTALVAGQPFNAVPILDSLVKAQPESAQLHFLLASAFAATRNVSGMQEHLLAGFRLDPKSALAQETLMSVYAALPDSGSKRALLAGLKDASREATGILLLEARLLIEEGNYPDGLKRLAELHRSRPKDRAIFIDLLTAQVKAGELFPATQTAQTWVTANPDDHGALALLGDIYIRRGRMDKGLETYRALVLAAPQEPSYNHNLAALLLDKQPAEALTYAKAAAAAAPDAPRVAATLGTALLANGDAPGGVKALARAHAALPTEPSIAYEYAAALAATGDAAQARSVLLPVMEKTFPDKDKAQALLRQLMP